VYENAQFVGFMMPLAFENSIQLYELCMPNIKKNLPKIWHDKYNRTNKTGIEARIKLCVNIASAIYNIHSLKKYVLVDMKPQNILITPEGKIAIIDTDSVQIAEDKTVLFSAQVATAEYVASEGNKLNPSKDCIPETWDRFSLAVIFYEIMFGVHPYVATFKHPYQNHETIASKIESSLFVHGKNKRNIQQLPPPHQNFDLTPDNIKTLFLRAFEEGEKNPQFRPTAEEWGEILYQEVGKTCLQNAELQKQIQEKETQMTTLKNDLTAKETQITKQETALKEEQTAYAVLQARYKILETEHNLLKTPKVYTETINGVSFEMIKIANQNFYMAETQVTQAMWQAVMGNNPSDFAGKLQNPVEQVSWNDIVNDFLPALNKLTGKTYRLPTEAEWEYSAMGGENYQYPGSDNIDEVAWYDKNSGNTTHPVKQKKANAYGLYDMSGNVLEWCEDAWEDIARRVCRGGSYFYDSEYCTLRSRYSRYVEYRHDNIGLRVVFSAS